MIFFFKQKTAYEMRISDWSSDGCSSDLQADRQQAGEDHQHQPCVQPPEAGLHQPFVERDMRPAIVQHQQGEAQRQEAIDPEQPGMGMDRGGVESLQVAESERCVELGRASAGTAGVGAGGSRWWPSPY